MLVLTAALFIFCKDKTTNPDNKGELELLYHLQLPDSQLSVSSRGSSVMLSGEESGLRIYSLSDAVNPVITFHYVPPEGIPMAVYTNDYYYFAAYDMGENSCELKLFRSWSDDVPGWYSCEVPYPVEAIFATTRTYAYVTHGETGFSIIDISDSLNPELATTFDTPGEAHDIYAAVNELWLADGSAGIQVIDIADKYNPQIIDNIPTPGEAYSITIYDGRAYVADGQSGLVVIDSIYTNPYIKFNVDTPGMASDVSIFASMNFPQYKEMSLIPDFGGILARLGLSLFNNPTPVTDDIYAVIADGPAGVRVFKIDENDLISDFADFDTDGYASRVSSFYYQYNFNNFCIADNNDGITLLQLKYQ